MSKEVKVKICKNKKCQKVLPDGYKHKYCEACRNKYAGTAREVLKGIGAVVVGGVILVLKGGKIDSKK